MQNSRRSATKSANYFQIMPSLIHKRPDGTEKKVEFGSKPLIIGRLSGSEIQVHDSFISRVHCGITYANNQFTLKDLGSTNGTYRNGARVFEGTLSSGDKIQVGNTALIFEIDSTNTNCILRQVPQMSAPPSRPPAPAPPPPSQMNHTAEVKFPSQPPPPPGVTKV
jgi:pSer/pThr/pTyr-binding forkhead associated (FHA) protein